MRSRKPAAALLTLVLAAVGLAPVAAPAASAVEPTSRVTDPVTREEYPGSARPDYFQSSANTGRIATDKSVFGDDTSSIPGPPLDLADDEFAVALSALGSTRRVTGEEQVPIDVSLILDNSRSMVQCTDQAGAPADGYCNDQGNWQGSRAFAMARAVDEAIRIIAEDFEENRIALVEFGTQSSVLQPLGPARTIPGSDRYVDIGFTGTNNGQMRLYVGNQTLLVGGTEGNLGTYQSTNIHRGLAAGMNQLATQDPDDVTGENQRIPNVLLFSDGEPTLSAAQAQWWNPGLSGTNQGPTVPGQNQFYGNGFLAALTGSLLKNQIDDVYDTHPEIDAGSHVYTVGLGMGALTTNGRDLAVATLDPRHELDTANPMAQRFAGAFTTYSESGSVSVAVNGTNNGATPTQYFQVSRPTGDAAAYDPTDLRYNDEYYAPVTEQDLIDVFTGIAQQMVDAAPSYPIDLEGASPAASGYVTFTDSTGAFMEVTDVDRITFCTVREGAETPRDCTPRVFTQHEASTDGNTTTYTFAGEYQPNSIHPPTPLANIRITVKRSDELAVGDLVTVRIPAALLPLRYAQVHEDADGNPETMSVTMSHPVSVYYTSTPKPGVTDALADPLSLNTDGSQDGTALAQYVRDHTVDGQVRFYADDWDSAAAAAGGTDLARTHASFVPAEDNRFYRFAEPTTIYTGDSATQPLLASEWDALADDATLSFQNVVYRQQGSPDDVVKELLPLTTTKAALELAGLDPGTDVVDGMITAPTGMPDFSGRAANLDHVKCDDLQWDDDNLPFCGDPDGGAATLAVAGNHTATDDWVRRTTWGADSGAVTTAVRAALGNNGFLEYPVPGSLSITKRVEAAAGLAPDPATAFTFRVDLAGPAAEGTYPYAVYDTDDPTVPVREGEISDGGTLTLLAEQTAVVLGLPDGTAWTVTEIDPPPGYSTASDNPQSGAVTIPQETPAEAEFVNVYGPEPARIEDGPTVEKVFEGRPWLAEDTFDVQLCPADDADDCETVTLGPATPSASFGSRTFDAPGTYTFAIREVPGSAPGVRYSAAEYEWEVEVTDTGTGQLTAAPTLTRVRDDAGDEAEGEAALAVFTNAFSAEATTVSLGARKLVDDLTRPDAGLVAPEHEHTFLFRFLGAQGDAPPAPTFDGRPETTVTTTAGNSQVTAPGLTFTPDHVGSTYYYVVTEVDGDLPGVTYSDAAFVHRLTVTATGDPAAVDVGTAVCRTTATDLGDAPDGGCTDFGLSASDVEFVNEYDAAPATADIEGTKVLTGRPWTDGDEFTFGLSPSGDDTEAAVGAGTVVLPDPATVTVDATDATGDAAPFAFDEITFTQQGRFQFRVEEVLPAPPGIAPDRHWFVVDVTVTDEDLDGRLEATATPVDGEDSATFTNRWTGSITFASLDLLKVLDGRELALGEFEFSVIPADEASAVLAGIPSGGMTVTNGQDTDGPGLTHVLRGLVVTQDDLDQAYTYTVSEVGGDLGGVTHDPTVWTVTLVPTFVPETGELDIVTTVSDGQEETTFSALAGETPQITFRNEYTAGPGTATPEFSKTVTGRDWLPGETFTFEIEAVTEGAPLPGSTTVTVAEDQAGSFGFGPIEFTEPGEFVYLVREVVPDPPAEDMQYDAAEAEVTITVTDDGTGTLATQVEYDGDENFVNVYQPPTVPGAAVIEGTKVLTGRPWAEGDEFTFALTPGDDETATAVEVGAVILPDPTTVTVTASDAADDGSAPFAFAPVTFTVQGTYRFQVAETRPETPLPGIEYDDHTLVVEATVTDEDLDGRLDAETAVVGDSDSATFTNAYESGPTPTPTPTPSPTEPGPAPTEPGPAPTGPPPTDPNLPVTGAMITGTAAMAFLLLALGTLFLRFRKAMER
ncbi:Spy0128 family protein [Myceligenerans pegani]|uniref:VWFA domain-containing protein n=1 Tax=Myceligenerans pegani TaxID=2776917 RepID=A0ABR9MZ37_9MICO|nr:FctA domain-containing protein [Myceligenerans sp. TRM 65318]MBE1876659.1 hypothetical protein [Myceligenerans sp. TRM 65318]MBE3018930.1 hypothetical protein [Myceligenerans sp. TRM 65318]